jgi:hypothetical protein
VRLRRRWNVDLHAGASLGSDSTALGFHDVKWGNAPPPVELRVVVTALSDSYATFLSHATVEQRAAAWPTARQPCGPRKSPLLTGTPLWRRIA